MQPNVKSAHRTGATLKDDSSHRDQFWSSLIFCTSGAESYQEEHWRPMWQCACFGWDDLIYMTRPSKEERIEICCKRSILKLEEDLDFISDGKLPNIDGELYQAWDVCAILLSPLLYKIVYCSHYYWFNLTHLCSRMHIVGVVNGTSKNVGLGKF